MFCIGCGPAEILRRVFAKSGRKSGKISKLWSPTPPPQNTHSHTHQFYLISSLSFFFSILKGALCYKHVLSSFIYPKFGKIVMAIFFLIQSYELLKTVKASVLFSFAHDLCSYKNRGGSGDKNGRKRVKALRELIEFSCMLWSILAICKSLSTIIWLFTSNPWSSSS